MQRRVPGTVPSECKALSGVPAGGTESVAREGSLVVAIHMA
jgi:hypothetical protein